jgi:hypothetical protein
MTELFEAEAHRPITMTGTQTNNNDSSHNKGGAATTNDTQSTTIDKALGPRQPATMFKLEFLARQL